MALTVVSGAASTLNQSTDLSYAASGQYGPIPIQNQILSLRIGNSPIFFRTRTLVSISEGDNLAAAGTMKNGTLQALAVRNLTTGAIYHPPTTTAMIMAVVLLVMGVPLIPFLGIGLLFVGMGGWVLYKGWNVRQAVALLNAPGLAAAATT